ncbi:G-protein coupled receptor 84-like [Lytechinus variegatus]|uniref:G-protein coupled receptor 84-like n=1 Tax=Lytechinus variegatus TaxID=7654 RepID=UPI001BB1CF03|nr:G-protein coupled receptor 84-like [Lytechinus variegatus]
MDELKSGATNTTSGNNDFMFESYPQRVVIAFILCLITVVGIVGNIHVILAVLLCRKLRSSTNWLIVNLGMADLLTCLFLPFNVVAMVSKDGWPFAEWICAMTGVVTLTCLGASIISLVLIAHNRWTLLTKPRHTFYRIYSSRNLIGMAIVSWMYPLLLVIIPSMAGLAKWGYSENYKTCLQDTTLSNSIFYSIIGLVGCIIPAAVAIVIIYILVYQFVSRHNKALGRMLTDDSRDVRTSCMGVDSSWTDSQGHQKSVDLSGPRSTSVNSVTAGDTTRSTLRTMPISNVGEATNQDISVDHELAERNVAKRQMELQLPIRLSGDLLGNREWSMVTSQVENRAPGNELSEINREISASNPTKTPASAVDSRSSPKISRHHINVTKRLSSLVICFFICFLPFGICLIVPTSDPVVPWGHLLFMVNSCINPFIYAGTMPIFRKVMISIVRCRFHSIPDHVDFVRFCRSHDG